MRLSSLMLITGLVVGGGAYVFSDHTTTPETPCHSDWKKCTDNEDMANHYFGWTTAGSRCARATEKQSRYGDPEWPFWIKFGRFHGGKNYISSGVATLIETGAKVPNQYGAKEHSRVVCEYDLQSEKVISVDISPSD